MVGQVGEGPQQPAPISKFFVVIIRRHIHHIQPLVHRDIRQDPGKVGWLWRLKGGWAESQRLKKKRKKNACYVFKRNKHLKKKE